MKFYKYKAAIFALSLSAIMLITGCGQLTADEIATNSSSEYEDETEPVTEEEITEEVTIEAETTEEITTEEVTTEPVTEELTTEAPVQDEDDVPEESSMLSEQSSGNTDIIPGISIGTSSEKVLKMFGSDYDHYENYSDLGIKDAYEYSYALDSVETFGIDMKTNMFFEFDMSDKLVCYGYHIGMTGDYDFADYPYSEQELSAAYEKIYAQLSQWYGEGEEMSNFGDMNVAKEYSWDNEYGGIWFIYGTDLWSYEGYNSGINEIVLSCADPER